MTSPALLSTQLNGNGHGRIASRSPTKFLYAMQQVPSAPKQTPVPVPSLQNPVSNSNTTFAPVVASDLPPAANTASPANDEEQRAQRFADDYARLCALMNECDPDAVRRAVRDNHERCLLGSHYHTAFLMNVTMHRADAAIMQRAIRDFGSRIVSAGKHDLIDWMSQADIDEVADKIIAKASNTFLDKALVARLPTIEARRLVNALARAERLGYDAADIVENEHVIPSLPSSAPSAAVQQRRPAQPLATTLTQNVAPAPTQMAHQQLGPADPSNLKCPNCQYAFPGLAAYDFHVKRMICTRPVAPPGPGGERYICPHCDQSFGGMGGLQYHMLNKVCGDFGEVIKERIVATQPLANLNPPTKRPAPDTAPTYVSSGSNSPAHSTHPVATQTPRAAPPRTQASSSQAVPLGTPQAKDMAHLTAHQIQALQGELRLAEETFKMKINDTQRAGGDPDEVQKKLTSLKNSYACKQSTIRKKYGIRLRQRRGREEMEHERVRMGIPDHLPRATATPTRDAHADKRARINGDGDATTTRDSRQGTPIKTVAVTEMGNGLNGSNATVATKDPTLSTSQAPGTSQGESSRPSSSYQQGNYRVEVHLPSPSKGPNSAAPNGTPGDNTPSRAPSGGTMTAEKLLQQMRAATGASNVSASDDEDDSSSDESNTDD
ncbi:hypothetical protein ColLi_03209 [Colletotrichum liriopes]|uniref:Uncharacterized protein n=1 Tax=Colletotrichum liriopes TaxID=708192 RepID=A0AA37GG82_9PEZI|nr:hypothetical protein ColLi_03209 [Colletotrichum liriopes]